MISEGNPPGVTGGRGSSTISLGAEGATDAYVDAHGRLTAESSLAAAWLVTEAGGWVVGIDGPPLPAATVLTDRGRLIAAGSRDLCDAIVD